MKRRAYGSGSIQEREDGRYVVQVNAGVDKNGKRKRITRVATTQKEASTLLRRLQTELKEGALEASSMQTVSAEQEIGMLSSELFNRWYDSKKTSWSPRTKELYRHQLDVHAIPHLGSVPLEDLRPLHIQEMVDALVKQGKVATANKVRSMVSSALKQAVRWELIGRNPADAVDPIREERRPLSIWTPQQALKFLKFHQEHRFYAAFYLLITSGIRRGELLGLRR